MKVIVVFLLLVFFYKAGYSQKLDQCITDIASDIAQKVTKKNKVRLALTDFVNNEGKIDALTDYVRKELEINLINAENLQVMDRKHIKLLLSDNSLQTEGLIDESIAKSSTSFIKVDGWVIAEITTLGDKIKIKVTVSDVSTSLMYAASTSMFNADDPAVKSLLDPEIKLCSECNGRGLTQMQTSCTACEGKGSRVCKQCAGAGRIASFAWRDRFDDCSGCNGSGKSTCGICAGKGKTASYITCFKCKGKSQANLDGNNKNLVKKEVCLACSGLGKIKHQQSCSRCGGTGKLVIRSNYVDCNDCAGTTIKTSYNACAVCNGAGKL